MLTGLLVIEKFYHSCELDRQFIVSSLEMPPKKETAPEPKPLIGRIGTSLKIGIVGLPNVGKSTFFNVLTKSAAPAENFPFCTIDPNERVPDERFDWLLQHYKPSSPKIQAYLNIVDIAGLVKGAHEGQGLGNAFLSHIRSVDAIFHLCRTFESEEITHVEGDVNPVRDIEIINEELRLKDEESLNAAIKKTESLMRTDKKLKAEYDILCKIKTHLVDQAKHIRYGDWNVQEIDVLNKHLFITSKPVIYLVNMAEADYIRKKNKWLPKLKEWIDSNDPGAIMIPFSGAFEAKIAEMDEDTRKTFCEENKANSTFDKIIAQGYKSLNLMYFFTAGPKEVKAWTIQKGTKAPQAGGRIHSDFEKGFIMAEVFKFSDLKEEGSEAAVKAAGKYRQQGKLYVVEDGDIILFKFNAGAGLTAGKDAKKK